MLTRRDFLQAGTAAALGLALGGCGLGGDEGGGRGLQALFMQQAGYSADNIAAMTKSFEQQSGTTVQTTFVSYEALHDKIVAAAPAGTYDIVLLDVIWPAEFASRGLVQDVTGRYPSSWQDEMFAGALTTTKYTNKFYGVPWILDTKYFYLNQAMLTEAGVDPASLRSWDGVLTAARSLKRQGIVEYPIIWSWAQAEALMCDYATLLGAFGGRFLDDQGGPAFHTGGGVQALEFMVRSLDDGLSDPSSAESLEEDVRKVFSQGRAAFGENWTYMYNLANDPKESQVAGDVAIARTPAGPSGQAPGVNGSMAVAIAAGTSNEDAAWQYIRHLTARSTQERYAQYSLPVWKASYDEPDVIKQAGRPVVDVASQQLQSLILRPQVSNYNAFSQELQVAIQQALLGQKSPQRALDDAAAATLELLAS